MFIENRGRHQVGYLTLGSMVDKMFKRDYPDIHDIMDTLERIPLDYMWRVNRPKETGYYILLDNSLVYAKTKQDYQVRIDELGLVLPLLTEPIPYNYLGVIGNIHYQDNEVTVLQVTDVNNVLN